MKKYVLPAMLLAVFETVAVTLWLAKDNVFYLFNFSYECVRNCPKDAL